MVDGGVIVVIRASLGEDCVARNVILCFKVFWMAWD